MAEFNLDAVDDGGYKPVTIVYREQEYKLGANAYGLLMAPGLLNTEGKTEEQIGQMLLEGLPKLLQLLGPELAAALSEPTLAEQMVLVQAVTEVLNRLGRFRVSPTTD